MERLTKRNENGLAILNIKCPEGCEYSTCSMEEGYQCQHQCEGDIIEKLAEYEDLENTLNGISISQVVDGFIKTVESQTHEGYKNGRILTNAEADKWKEYKQLEEQGRLLKLPCKVGDTVWFIGSKCDKCEEDDCYQCPYNRYGNKRDERFIYPLTIKQFRVRNNSIYMVDTDCVWSSSEISINIKQFGKTVFLTKSEAKKKLKEMESD